MSKEPIPYHHGDPLDAKAVEQAKQLGMTEEEFRKYGPGYSAEERERKRTIGGDSD